MKNLKSWKTSLAGIIAIVTVIVEIYFPEYAPGLAKLAAAAVGAGLLAARDNNVSSEQAGAK